MSWRQAGRSPTTTAAIAAMMTLQIVRGSSAELSTSPRGSSLEVGTTSVEADVLSYPLASCPPTVVSSCATLGLAALASSTVI